MRAEYSSQRGLTTDPDATWHGRGRGRRHVFLAECRGRGAARSDAFADEPLAAYPSRGEGRGPGLSHPMVTSEETDARGAPFVLVQEAEDAADSNGMVLAPPPHLAEDGLPEGCRFGDALAAQASATRPLPVLEGWTQGQRRG